MVDLFDRIVKVNEEVNKGILENVIVICRDAGVGSNTMNQQLGEFAAGLCIDQIKFIMKDLDLVMQNEDWNWLSGQEKPVMYEHNKTPLLRNMVKITLEHDLDREIENVDYQIEKEFGILPREPYNTAQKSKGENIGQQLWDAIIEGPKREELNMMASEDERRTQAEAVKKAIRLYRQKYSERMYRNIPELRKP